MSLIEEKKYFLVIFEADVKNVGHISSFCKLAGISEKLIKDTFSEYLIEKYDVDIEKESIVITDLMELTKEEFKI